MALVYITLQNKLYDIFKAMNDIHSNGDEYMGANVADEISSYISQGTVNTVDSGVGSAGGSYTGKGTGTMKINTSLLKNKLTSTFLSKSNNVELARKISSDIDNVCSMQNTIKTNTSGTSVLPSSSYPDSGVGNGTFSSQSNIIYSKLKDCFDAMNKMYQNGNMYMAQEFAKAVDEYLKSGNINVNLQAPMSGSGSGKIS